ncbi:MAG: radical SAM protein [Candidatus Omnitrophota bacterium]
MKYKYVYGPVSSWRLGSSLGVDPVYTGRGKICSFNCIYCQVGKTRTLTLKRRVFVPASEIIEEIKNLPALKIDYITLSGAGEPTLARNLGDIIKKIRKIRGEKIAVLTNSSLTYKKDVRRDLSLADFVIAKLDAHEGALFTAINKPAKGSKLDKVVKGLKEFRSLYKGRLALQIMFVGKNKAYAKEIASLARKIRPNEVQINTPLRPCGVSPLPKKELDRVKKFFQGMNCTSVYDAKKKKVKPISRKSMLKRRGKI